MAASARGQDEEYHMFPLATRADGDELYCPLEILRVEPACKKLHWPYGKPFIDWN